MKRFFLCAITATVVAQSSFAYKVLTDTITGSDIYPSTTHTLQVTIPEGYSPEKPTLLYVGLDGILCNAPAVFDKLYAEGKLPHPVIGIFLQPGFVSDADGNVIRYNRSNEFDATDARFSTFLETEIIPRVQQLTTDDGQKITLPTNPDARMIFGLSSGGIAAFNAAWHRPDLFGRVFSGCGTFVPMRGGEELQVVVRKTEPKPLRIFLQDGFSDAWNPLFGSWFEANAMLGTALEFAGYQCRFDWQEGVHSVKRATEIFPEVVEWLWSDFSNPVRTGKTSNNFLAPLLIENEYWEETSTSQEFDYTHPDSIFAIYPDSSLIAVKEPSTNFIKQYLIDHNGNRFAGQRFYYLHSLNNSELQIGSMTFDGNGYLWVVSSDGLQACDQNGRVRGILPLPRNLNAGNTKIEISDGLIRLTSPTKAYERKLNITATKPGIKPKSQGQA